MTYLHHEDNRNPHPFGSSAPNLGEALTTNLNSNRLNQWPALPSKRVMALVMTRKVVQLTNNGISCQGTQNHSYAGEVKIWRHLLKFLRKFLNPNQSKLPLEPAPKPNKLNLPVAIHHWSLSCSDWIEWLGILTTTAGMGSSLSICCWSEPDISPSQVILYISYS